VNLKEYAIERPDERTMIYRMKRCRVQETRERKGLEDYPCKSGGIVEYTTFARTIDPAIVTECLGCPPDPHPRDCLLWNFTCLSCAGTSRGFSALLIDLSRKDGFFLISMMGEPASM
jgi:hypothetical protein